MSRFFLDHGVVHDRKTGQHVGMEAEPKSAERLLALLREMEVSADGWSEPAVQAFADGVKTAEAAFGVPPEGHRP